MHSASEASPVTLKEKRCSLLLNKKIELRNNKKKSIITHEFPIKCPNIYNKAQHNKSFTYLFFTSTTTTVPLSKAFKLPTAPEVLLSTDEIRLRL